MLSKSQCVPREWKSTAWRRGFFLFATRRDLQVLRQHCSVSTSVCVQLSDIRETLIHGALRETTKHGHFTPRLRSHGRPSVTDRSSTVSRRFPGSYSLGQKLCPENRSHTGLFFFAGWLPCSIEFQTDDNWDFTAAFSCRTVTCSKSYIYRASQIHVFDSTS